MDPKEIDELMGAYSKFKGKISPEAVYAAEEELEKLKSKDICFVGWTQEDYPALLKDCEDPPIGLYVRSTSPPSELWKEQRRIAVIGTRDISAYGKQWCNRIVEGLASTSEKPVIVSGLALGTDFCAHTAALEYGLPTIGVMATGAETVYPYRHREFAERMYHCPGCALISDYPPETPPLSIHFLRRNRIIAGLSEATILVESRLKGGGMMTSNLAFSYGRNVYALPGRIDDPRSQGCNYLIMNKIAEPIMSIEAMLKDIGLSVKSKNCRQSAAEIFRKSMVGILSSEDFDKALNILNIISKNRGIELEDIASSTGLMYNKLAHLINILESEGFITIDLLQRCSINSKKF